MFGVDCWLCFDCCFGWFMLFWYFGFVFWLVGWLCYLLGVYYRLSDAWCLVVCIAMVGVDCGFVVIFVVVCLVLVCFAFCDRFDVWFLCFYLSAVCFVRFVFWLLLVCFIAFI